jgi:DNA-directed RNA polymerase specialized sigma24 family protein
MSQAAGTADQPLATADAAVTALYQAHALGLTRLAHVMLGDASSAEDVVQEAFCGLYRRWGQLAQTDRALYYVRSSVLNGCR